MSCVAMSQTAYARRSDTKPESPTIVTGVNEAAHGSDAPNNSLTAALGAIVSYIPTELVALYTALVAGISAVEKPPANAMWAVFWTCLALTPCTVWLLYAARLKADEDDKPPPKDPRSWPWVEMFIGTVGFIVWASALPSSPVRGLGFYQAWLTPMTVLIVPFVLGLVAPLLARNIKVS